jgi:hypothetical protein
MAGKRRFDKPKEGVTPRIAAGEYQVVTDEELIDGLSFPVDRRTHSRA